MISKVTACFGARYARKDETSGVIAECGDDARLNITSNIDEPRASPHCRDHLGVRPVNNPESEEGGGRRDVTAVQ